MDPVIFTGRLDAEEFRRDHHAEYERLRREERLDRLRADPAGGGLPLERHLGGEGSGSAVSS